MNGETIKEYKCFGSYLCIHFVSGGHQLFGIERGWESGEEEIEERNDSDLDDYDLSRFGLITEEEFAKRKAAKDAKSKESQESYERRQYDALKKKFES